MKPSTKHDIKGTLHEVKGKIKEKAGQVTNNPDLEAEGKAEGSDTAETGGRQLFAHGHSY
jgi:uncharacterized protein YjbJ (UPF0337 family)